MAQPDALSHLSSEHRRLFFEYGCGESKVTPYTSLVDAFQTHVQTNPEAIAVEYLGESITYGELDHQSSQLAALLKRSGVDSEHRVMLLVKRSIPMVVGILGVLKAGAAYVPLDGGIVPDKTLAHIVSDANVRVVLTLKAFASRVSSYDSSIFFLDEPFSEACAPESLDDHKFTGYESAYIVYTSGTTGTPKGVDVTHRNVLNLIGHSPGNLGMTPGMRVSQLLNIAFDMAQWECLGSLTNGCTLCLRGSNWLDVLRTVDIVISTPSCLRNYTPADFKPQAIATAGEPCPQSLADRWVASGTKFFNCCGPTETTIVNTVYEHSEVGKSLSIGRPTPNNSVYILDEDMVPVPIGEVGMMWAGGLGIARGYLNLPEKTAACFRPDIFAGNGSMMYKTGDLGQWRNDGSGLLDVLGRTDDQAKIKGFRVELDGVAATMETTAGVHSAVALLIDEELVGVYSPDSVDENAVMQACTNGQPYYARPSRYVKLSEMPMTSNGKTDKKLLREIVSTSSSGSEPMSDTSMEGSSPPSSVSSPSDEEHEPHVFSSATKLSYEKVAPVTWESPESLIPTRGRLFVNVIERDGSTFSSRSSIFSRNRTPSASQPPSELAERERTSGADAILSEPADHINSLAFSEDTTPQDPVTSPRSGMVEDTHIASPASVVTSAPKLDLAEPDSLEDRLLLAVPKKGRLHDKCIDMLRGADLQFTKSNRLDICIVKNLPIALVFLPAADIPRFVGESNVDVGITGQDVILESNMQGSIEEILPLGFGRCKLQVQVPADSGIEREEELAGKRIATSFETVVSEYFGRIDKQIGTRTKIEHIGGSVETACTLGLADGIVDLVESGETMRVAGLKPIGTILSSEATLIMSSRPKKPYLLPLIDQLKSRLAGVAASSTYILCQYNIRREDLPRAKAITPGRRAATVSPLDREGWATVSSMVERGRAAVVMDELEAAGAEEIIMLKIENCRV
ncbi:hypothetical protein FRC12_024565 [Ceratobasidium sp. 428]|nr:hypothetical protein FRC12_024565 [Ceratobasidium sp. 428]